MNPDHIPHVLFQYVRTRDYTWGGYGLQHVDPQDNLNNQYFIVDDQNVLWREADINSDGTVGVGMYGKAASDSDPHPWQACKIATLPEAYWADAWYGRLWIRSVHLLPLASLRLKQASYHSVLQQSFRKLWDHHQVVRADNPVYADMHHYRTDWFAALTGLHGRVYAYGKDEPGMWLYQTHFLRCGSVPTIITTDDSDGTLPKNTDLTVNTIMTPADPSYALDTLFEIFEPFTQTRYNASLKAIVAQTRWVVSVDDSVLAAPQAPPANAKEQFRPAI